MSQEQNNNQGQQPKSNAVEKTAEAVQKGKKMVDNVKKAKKIANAAKTLSMSGPLMYVLFWVFVVIVAIIIITGIVMFLVTMPGMVMDKLKALFKEIGNYVSAFFGADTTEQIDDVQIYETLDYIEDMGWDLKSEGFLTKYYADTNPNGLSSIETSISDKLSDEDKEAGYDVDEKQGVVRGDGGTIILADSDFIFTYIMSDNYVYTLKNDNLVTQDKADSWWESIGKGIVTGWYKVRNFFAGPLLDVLGVTDAAVEGWGKGLIVIYYDDGLGKRGTVVNDDSLWNWDSVKIDPESKKLSIKRVEFLNNNNAIEFSLDGWTGRYGMPLEFLLSVHKATMMPDLAYDMATSFNTNIHLYLHDISGEATAAYKTPDGKYITYEEINVAKTGLAGRNWFSAIIAWFDNLNESDEETIAMKELGIDVINGEDGCECDMSQVYYYDTNYELLALQDGKYYYYKKTTTGEGESATTTTEVDTSKEYTGEVITETKVADACSHCESKSKKISQVLSSDNDYNFKAYDPYIANVSNHWYRDVYFVLNNDTKDDYSLEGDIEFVDYDYEYEALMNERWTLYETYTDDEADKGTYKYNPQKAGEFIAFVIDENGKYKKNGSEYVIYDGTFDEARGTTLYTKDAKGDYVMYTGAQTEDDDEEPKETLYRYMGDGKYEVYDPDVVIAVAKKAITIDASDTTKLEDLEWKKTNGVWTAYEEEAEASSTGWQPLFTEDQLAEESDALRKEVKSKTYINVTTTGNIVQTGEGQRTQTNYEIKKMFLQNRYFRYDGSEQTAEIITEIRKKNKINYGPLSEDDLEKTATIDGETYKAKDYSGVVVLNQDSLNAFSMLENTHTLDADYIYRDFKELIVELGYFEKEELTDETPRLLQFLIPDIANGGFPDHTIDKRENEFGTMVHSKGDIDANKKYTLKAFIERSGLTEAPEGAGQEQDWANGTDIVDKKKITTNGILSKVATLNNVTPMDRFMNVGAIQDIGETDWDFKGVANSGKGVKTGDLDVNGVAYETWRQTASTCTLYSFAFMASAYTGEPFFDYVTGNGILVNKDTEGQGPSTKFWQSGIVWGPMAEEIGGGTYYTSPSSTLAEEVAKALGEGKPVYFYGDYGASAGYHAVVLLGSSSGGVLLYNPGGGTVETYGSGGFASSLASLIDTHCFTQSGHRIFIPDKVPDGVKKGGDPYVGYQGNEAVVSPVTGILLEYGTYDENDVEKLSEEDEGTQYRLNVDLKYGPSINLGNTEGGEENADPNNAGNNNQNNAGNNDQNNAGNNGQDEENDIVKADRREFSDKVGYAKILVLDNEHYKKLESTTSNQWKSQYEGQGLQNLAGNYREGIHEEDDLKDMSVLNKTIYGYKEFVEKYEQFGIAGYVIYIDGFKCELPDESLQPAEGDEESDISEKIPSGKPLTIDSFKIKENKLESENELIQTKYESDPEYKTASEKITNRMNAETIVKTDAYPVIYTDDIIFIKEGTVIGRTYTDKELVEQRLADGDDQKYKYEYYRPDKSAAGAAGSSSEEDESKLLGNYLRIIMRDLDDKVIEDVETYMKLDELMGETMADDVLTFLAGVMTAESGPDSEDGLAAAAWVIKNRLDDGRFGETLEEILVAPNQFEVVAKSPEECVGGYYKQGETVSIQVNGTMYYVNAPSPLALEIAKGVIESGSISNPGVADRLYWKSAGTNVDASKDPVQIPPGSGNKYHY